jgi:hypothetical protein
MNAVWRQSTVLGLTLMLAQTAWGTTQAECVRGGEQQAAAATDNAAKRTACNDLWGIEVQAIRRTSAGYMLDFRYRVTEPDKAKLLLDRKIKPYVIVEGSGAELQVPVSPKIGPLRQSSSKVYADRNYFMLFGNPGRRVKAGDKVTVVVGDFRVEHIVVE